MLWDSHLTPFFFLLDYFQSGASARWLMPCGGTWHRLRLYPHKHTQAHTYEWMLIFSEMQNNTTQKAKITIDKWKNRNSLCTQRVITDSQLVAHCVIIRNKLLFLLMLRWTAVGIHTHTHTHTQAGTDTGKWWFFSKKKSSTSTESLKHTHSHTHTKKDPISKC